LHEEGHPESWIIAMDCLPTRAAALDYGSRWAIDATFSDFKGRGFQREDSQREHADRLERLILIMALAIHWCVRIGQDDALQRPTPLEKKECTDRSQTLGLQKTPPQHGVLVHPRTTILEKVFAK
jgi:hypothetical protein